MLLTIRKHRLDQILHVVTDILFKDSWSVFVPPPTFHSHSWKWDLMMLHRAAGCVFVVFVWWAECECVSCLWRFACASVLPGWAGWGWVPLSPYTGVSLCPLKGRSFRKETPVTRDVSLLTYCRFKTEKSFLLFSVCVCETVWYFSF